MNARSTTSRRCRVLVNNDAVTRAKMTDKSARILKNDDDVVTDAVTHDNNGEVSTRSLTRSLSTQNTLTREKHDDDVTFTRTPYPLLSGSLKTTTNEKRHGHPPRSHGRRAIRSLAVRDLQNNPEPITFEVLMTRKIIKHILKPRLCCILTNK